MIYCSLSFLLFSMVTQVDGFLKCQAAYDLNQCSAYHDLHHQSKFCSTQDICRKTFNFTTMEMKPYNFHILMHMVLRLCCGTCVKTRPTKVYDNVTSLGMNFHNQHQFHFAFPVMGPASRNRLHGYFFMPFVDPPIIYYITEIEGDVLSNLLALCYTLWHVVAFVASLVALSGFICWLMETWGNKSHFPRPFLIGWFEGIWWSFISMTTVGYGDRVPKSLPARLFAMFWIVFGISTLSIFTAMLTAQITVANYPSTPEIANARVGALKHRTYDASVIARYGGIIHEVEEENATMSIIKLVRMLRSKQVDGFVLDRYTFVLFLAFADKSNTTSAEVVDDMEYLRKRTIHTEKAYQGERLTFGVLVREEEDYEFLKDFLLDNGPVINTCIGLYTNVVTQHQDVNVKHVPEGLPFSSFAWSALTTTSIALLAVVCFGAVYEIIRPRGCG